MTEGGGRAAGSSGVRGSGHLAPGQFPQLLGARRGSWDCKGAACECGAGRRGGRAWGQRWPVWGLCAGGRHSGRETSPPAEGPLCLGLGVGGTPWGPCPRCRDSLAFHEPGGRDRVRFLSVWAAEPFHHQRSLGLGGWICGCQLTALVVTAPHVLWWGSRASRLGRHILPPTPPPSMQTRAWEGERKSWISG